MRLVAPWIRTMGAAGLGSALALTTIGGAGAVLADAGEMSLGSPDGYVLEVDAAGVADIEPSEPADDDQQS